MPRFGVIGAAIAFLLSYLTQTVVAFFLARRFYTIEYEHGRIARIVAAAIVAAACALWLVPPMPPLAGFLTRGSVTVAAFAGLLWGSGFFRPTERAFLREQIDRFRHRAATTS